ncbi:MAG: KOW domain-containing RNA-binding protein [Acutalibacteraceae bacterium]|nr:KOW domain-containing RNA-binding protein [Acutalibacteraceae bacterium]
MVGRIVCSKSGRDKGYFLVVIKEEDGFLLVCDGKERPLSRPKKKNPKHLALTNTVLSEDSYSTDKSLRRALAIYRDSVL